MKLLLFVNLILLVGANLISDPNCLESNPGALDAKFGLLNKFENRNNVTSEDVGKLAALFSTRFKRAHEFTLFSPAWIKRIGTGIALNSEIKKNFKIFIRVDPNYKRTVKNRYFVVLKDYYDVINQINSGNEGPLAGLYLHGLGGSLKEHLEAVEGVFGPKENSTFPIGRAYEDCFNYFKPKAALNFLQRMQFISCSIYPAENKSPEKSANEVLQKCSQVRSIAHSINITAEIMCSVSYPSFGTSPEGIAGSVSDFQKFWCTIIEEVARNKSHPQIIMSSGFDDSRATYNLSTLLNGDYHSGWWRRRHATSYDASAFVEKVEELDGGREIRNCASECSLCNSSSECCAKMFCYVDTSNQPYEMGVRQRVCQSQTTKCAPRTPPASKAMEVQAKPSSPSDSGISPFTMLYIVFFLSATIVIAVVFSAIFILRKRNSNVVLTQPEDGPSSVESNFSATKKHYELLEGHLMDGDVPYDQSLEVAKHTFEIYESQILGCGNYGVVYKGRLLGDDVAVKMTLPGVDKQYLKALRVEINVHVHLGQHENIVKLLGAHTPHQNTGAFHMFLELCPLGNLQEFLRIQRENFREEGNAEINLEQQEKSHLNCKRLVQWSCQIANAIGHLADKKVIHADIAARNILVYSMENVKLTDFGLSRRLYEYSSYARNKQELLPWRHMSTEALQDLNFSAQSDVWAFGVTLWEIFSLGMVPYPGYLWSMDFLSLLLEGMRLPCPPYAHPLIYDVMTSCWTNDVQTRPKISVIEKELASALNHLFTNRNYLHVQDVQ